MSLPRTGLSARCRDLYRAAWQQLRSGDLEAAVSTCRTLNEEFSRFEEGWYLRSVVASRLGNWQKALDFAERALQFKQENLLFLCQKANCLVHLNRPLEGRALADAVAERRPEDAVTLAGVGTVLAACGEHEKALAFYQAAVTRQPNSSLTLFNLGATQRALGDYVGAEASYDAGLALNPHGYEAYLIRAELRTQTAEHNHIAEMEQMLDDGAKSWRGEARLCYALAKEYEDLEHYAKAFDYAVRGARLKRAHLKYEVDRDVNTIDQIISTFDTTYFAEARTGCESSAPIFIVGLPFGGGSLIERILAGHSSIASGGERHDFPREVMSLLSRPGSGNVRPRPEHLPRAVGLNLAKLGENYRARVESQVGTRSRFTDSLPLNYLYLGLIAKALPDATLIEAVSDPIHTCYAMFRTLFKRAYPFSYDFKDLGRYYGAYQRMMSHWHSMLPGRILKVRYESLMGNFEEEAKKLVVSCGLEWEPGCLTPAATSPASGRVGRPRADAPPERWHHYAKELKPLIQALGENGVPQAQDQHSSSRARNRLDN